MKKLFINVIVILVTMFALVGCNKTEEQTEKEDEVVIKELTEATAKEARKCFNFFWATANTNEESDGYGLIPDRYSPTSENNLASIASVGFGLTAIPIGIENGWIKKEAGQERVLKTLKSIKELEKVEGFFYHFYMMDTGEKAYRSEVSNIDTAIFLCGALFAGQYFGGEIQTVAQEIYDEVNWPWFINPKTNQFYMGYFPYEEDPEKKFDGAWDWYGEQLMMYFLAAGSKNYPITVDVYNAFNRNVEEYAGREVISSFFGSIFTYQFSHAWIDFRNLRDAKGVDWYQNSVNATYANYQYCIDKSPIYTTFSKTSWGLTACDGPNGYKGTYGAAPSGGLTYESHEVDGTVALCGAIGSIAFAPEIVIPTIDYYYNTLDGKLFQGYGFVDSYNLENGEWIANDVIGIDKGISLLMIENYRSEFVWEVFMECDFMNTAIEVLQFTETK